MSHRRFLFALGVLLALAMFSGAMIVKTTASKAHDFYPIECCSGIDCAPVEKVEIVANSAIASMLVPPANASVPSTMVVTTKHGTAAVPQNIKHRESKDGRVHACIRSGKLICIFLPPSM